MNFTTLLLPIAVLIGLVYFQARTQRKQAEKRMESLSKLQKGHEVITIGGLYGTIDEVDTEKKTVVLDVDGVYLTFELSAIKTILPIAEGIPAVAGVDGEVEVDLTKDDESAIEE